MGLTCIRKRQDSAYPDSQCTAIDRVGDLRQVLGCNIDQEECRVDAIDVCKLLIRLGHGRNQLAAATQDLE
jgi:hypothetical protein